MLTTSRGVRICRRRQGYGRMRAVDLFKKPGDNETMINPPWLAGFFDGDGSVGIYRRKARDRHPEEWFLRIGIGQKDRQVLDLIQDEFGGHLRHRGSVNKHGRYGEVWELVWTHKKAEHVLEAIAPHSLVKADEVKIAQEFRTLKNKVGQPNAPREQYEELATRLKDVKKKRNAQSKDSPKTATLHRVDEAG